MVTCRNGHERTVENTHIRPNGRKRCRDCECASAKIRYRLENPEVRANGLRDRCGHMGMSTLMARIVSRHGAMADVFGYV